MPVSFSRECVSEPRPEETRPSYILPNERLALYNFSRREDRKKLRNCSRLKEAKKNVTIKCKVLSWTKQERDIVGIVEI